MELAKRHLAIGSLTAIAISVGFLVSRYLSPPLDVKPNQAVGEVLAEETVRVLGGQGEVVLVTLDPTLSKAVKIQTESFVRALKKKRSVTIAATEHLQRSDALRADLQKELPPERFLSLVETYPQAAIVSLVGAPRLQDTEAAKLPQPPPKVLAVVRSYKELQRLFENGLLQVAIVPRCKFPAPVEKPRRLREWFDKYFQVLTSASELPPEVRTPIERRKD